MILPEAGMPGGPGWPMGPGGPAGPITPTIPGSPFIPWIGKSITVIDSKLKEILSTTHNAIASAQHLSQKRPSSFLQSSRADCDTGATSGKGYLLTLHSLANNFVKVTFQLALRQHTNRILFSPNSHKQFFTVHFLELSGRLTGSCSAEDALRCGWCRSEVITKPHL